MAKKSLIAKASRKPKFDVRGYHRCTRCGAVRRNKKAKEDNFEKVLELVGGSD